MNCFGALYKQHGFFGMWRGWAPNCQRAAFVQLGDIAAYDVAKQAILRNTSLKDNFFTHGLASIAAGFVAFFFFF